MKKEYLYFHQDILILTLHMYNYKPITGLKTDKELYRHSSTCQQTLEMSKILDYKSTLLLHPPFHWIVRLML